MSSLAGKLNKSDLIEIAARETFLPKKEVETIINSFVGRMYDALVDNMTIELRGFGTFEVRYRKGRNRTRNPKTGEIHPLPPYYSAVFRSGRDLKKILKEKADKENEQK